jgi:hypothetical protein
MSYQAVVQDWRDFYIVAGTAAATLVGLLFVGLSLHLRVVLSRPEVRSLARVTLANFALILFVSMFTLIREGASSGGLQLFFSGVVSLAVVAPNLVAAAKSSTRTFRVAQLLFRFGVSVAAFAGVIVAGRLVAHGSFRAGMSWLATTTIVLLVVSLRNSWDLLVSVGSATQQ